MTTTTEVWDACLRVLGGHGCLAELCGRGRAKELIRNRWLVVGALRELPDYQPSFPEIMALFGAKNCSTHRHQYDGWMTLPEDERGDWLAIVREMIDQQRKEVTK